MSYVPVALLESQNNRRSLSRSLHKLIGENPDDFELVVEKQDNALP